MSESMPLVRVRAKCEQLERELRKSPDFRLYLLSKSLKDRARSERMMMQPSYRHRLMNSFAIREVLAAGAALLLCGLGLINPVLAKPFMIVGLDEKLVSDDDGKPMLSPPGKDNVLIVDLANPESPKIVATVPLKNSVVGPPVNVDIDPTGTVALVADSVDNVNDGDALKQVPDNKIHVIDMKADPPKLAATVTGGKQPSGLSFSPDGKMALVANRGDNSISVLSVNGTDVKITDTVAMPDSVAHVLFTPDGKRALAVRFPAHKVSVLDVADGKVTYNKVDLPTGPWPYNVVVVPNGKVALTSDNGGRGGLLRRQRRHHQRD